MMALPMHHMHDIPSARSPRRRDCTGDVLDLAWRAALLAEGAATRCNARTVSRLRRRSRGGHLATGVVGAPKRRPPGGRATGRLAR
jgi:hypothetical protein